MPAVVLEQVRAAQADLATLDMRGHAEETRRAIAHARVALYTCDDILARRAGETLCRGSQP